MSSPEYMDKLKISLPPICLGNLLVCFYAKLKTRQIVKSLFFHIILLAYHRKLRINCDIFLQKAFGLTHGRSISQ